MRRRAFRFAGAVGGLQVVWVLRLGLSEQAAAVAFVVLALAEITIPFWAERSIDRPPFHFGHIEERYGLFTILVLGESILSATAGFQAALDEGGLTAELFVVGVGGLVMAFAAWWIYFDHPGHLAPTPKNAFRWGYGHVVVFASLTAVGAGIEVAIEALGDHAPQRTAALAVAVPMACFPLGLALLMMLNGLRPTDPRVSPKLAGVVVMVIIGSGRLGHRRRRRLRRRDGHPGGHDGAQQPVPDPRRGRRHDLIGEMPKRLHTSVRQTVRSVHTDGIDGSMATLTGRRSARTRRRWPGTAGRRVASGPPSR